MEKNINCKKCKKGENSCKIYSLGDVNICKSCKLCRKCIKDKKECDECCEICKRCKKKMLKDNWPEDIILDGFCEKCHHLCKDCDKYLDYEKMYYKKKNFRYCIECFEDRYLSKDTKTKDIDEKKFKYKIVTKKEEYGNLFLSWKKTHEILNCTVCKKQFENYIFFNKTVCKGCVNKTKPTKKNELNPSTYDKIYIEKDKWILHSQRMKCINCYSSIWIEQKNRKNGQIYRCKNCPPSNIKNKKYKYDNIIQNWTSYREIIKCKGCSLEKWMFTKDITKDNLCKKCF